WHDAVVGGDDEDDDVRHLRAARAHHREGLVAWRVEEHDLPAPLLDVIGADVLRDAAGLVRRDVRLADRIEQRRLAVIDVAHDGDDRTAGHGALRLGPLHRLHLDRLFEGDDLRVDAQLARQLDRQLPAEGLIDRDHEPLLHEEVLHQIARLDVELLGELLDGDALGQRDLAGRLLELEHLRVHRRLLARVAARGNALRRLLDVRQHDVGTDVIGDDLRAGERTLREQLLIELRGARGFPAFAGGLLLLAALLGLFLLAADDVRAGDHSGRRWRRLHARTRTTRTAHARSRRARAHRTTRTRTAGTTRTRGTRRTGARGTRVHRRAGTLRRSGRTRRRRRLLARVIRTRRLRGARAR